MIFEGAEGCEICTQSIQVNPPTLAAKLVTIHASAALRFAANADPPLKPMNDFISQNEKDKRLHRSRM